MDKYPVKVYIYDLSMGMARSMSLSLIGKQIDGIWHTGIVVYGKEFFFGGGSIESCPPGGTIMGQPGQIVDLGTTEVPEEVFMDYLHELAVTSYRPDQYHLLHHNCNTFSDEVAKFLTGSGIPSHITSLPQEFLNTPFGQMVKPFIDTMSVNPGGQAHPVFSNAELQSSGATSAPAPAAASSNSQAQGATAQAAHLPNASKNMPNSPLAPVSHTADVSSFIMHKDKLKSVLSAEDFNLLEEVQEYLTKKDCSWAPARPHALVIDKILHDKNIDDTLRVCVGGLLQNLLQREDIVTQFRMDPKSKQVLKKLAHATKYYQPEMQAVAVRAFCNVTQDTTFRESLQKESQDALSIKGLCDVCTACMLSEPMDCVNTLGASLAYNVTLGTISEEQAVTLGSALVQYLMTSQDTQSASYSLHALHNCMKKNAEVVSFAAVMEIDLAMVAPDDETLNSVKTQIAELLTSAHSHSSGIALD